MAVLNLKGKAIRIIARKIQSGFHYVFDTVDKVIKIDFTNGTESFQNTKIIDRRDLDKGMLTIIYNKLQEVDKMDWEQYQLVLSL